MNPANKKIYDELIFMTRNMVSETAIYSDTDYTSTQHLPGSKELQKKAKEVNDVLQNLSENSDQLKSVKELIENLEKNKPALPNKEEKGEYEKMLSMLKGLEKGLQKELYKETRQDKEKMRRMEVMQKYMKSEITKLKGQREYYIEHSFTRDIPDAIDHKINIHKYNELKLLEAYNQVLPKDQAAHNKEKLQLEAKILLYQVENQGKPGIEHIPIKIMEIKKDKILQEMKELNVDKKERKQFERGMDFAIINNKQAAKANKEEKKESQTLGMKRT